MQLSIDSKVQFFAYQKLRDRCRAQGQGRQRGGAGCPTGEVLALANYPSYAPASART
jgi:cell division protein FtsI (penicillin-binding protein 3)